MRRVYVNVYFDNKSISDFDPTYLALFFGYGLDL